MKNICPVCGYDELDEPAYKGMRASLEICPCCGFQFGFDDQALHITHEQWRQKWVTNGMKWRSSGIKPPANWNPQKQLLNIGVKI